MTEHLTTTARLSTHQPVKGATNFKVNCFDESFDDDCPPMSAEWLGADPPVREPGPYSGNCGKESSGFSRLPARSRSLVSFDSNDRARLTRVWKNACVIDTNVISRMIGINFVLEALDSWIVEVKGYGDFVEHLTGGTSLAELLSA